jgi:PAS domain S-box-containing protein
MRVTTNMIPRRHRPSASDISLRQSAIEKTVSECSAKLSDCPAEQVDAAIKRALRTILRTEGADRASWFVIDRSGSGARSIYSVHRHKTSAEPAFYSRHELPWVTKVLFQGSPIVLSTLDDLPPEAQSDRCYMEQRSIKSLAMIPSSPGLPSRGVLVLVCMTNRREWSQGQIDGLSILGNIFASALVRKHAQKALKDSELKFSYVITEAPIGIALEDSNGKILFANPALCSMLGYTTEEMLSLNCSQFADPEDEKSDWNQFQAMQAGLLQSYKIEKRYTRKDGSRLWGQLNVSSLKFGEGPPLIIATVEDVTDRKAALDELRHTHDELQLLTSRLLQRQEDERSRIARELHDDIGQRLSLLTIELDSLKDQLPSDRTEEHRKIRSLVGQIEELVLDVHNMSHQLHSSKLKYLGLAVALKELCRQFSMKHQVAIDLSVDPLSQHLSEQVSLCLYRVAQEALSNAVRHSTSGHIEVKLTGQESILRLQIRDFGTGFDPSVQDKGLGLIAMQERLRIIEGKLRVNSSPGSGTEIVAEVNLERQSSPERVA